MTKKKKIIIGVILIIVAILIIVGIVFIKTVYPNTLIANQAQQSIACEKISNTAQKDLCLMQLAKLKGQLSICDTIPGEFKYECYSELAVEKGDASICEKIPPSTQTINPEERKWFCLKNVGIIKADSGICDKITNSQLVDVCYAGIIQKTGNNDLCEHFKGRVPPVDCVPRFELSP